MSRTPRTSPARSPSCLSGRSPSSSASTIGRLFSLSDCLVLVSVKDNTRLRFSRGLSAARLAARGGARYAANAPRLFAIAGEHRQQLRNDLALRTAQDIADTLGSMK